MCFGRFIGIGNSRKVTATVLKEFVLSISTEQSELQNLIGNHTNVEEDP